MASTYSTSLKIQLIGTGEQSGIWGSTTNTNWNLIEQAVAGVQTIVMANANYTLSNLNGVSCEARNIVIVATGTNSGVRQIVAPLVSKTYIITNNTTGGFAVTIGGATGAVVSIPNGYTAQVYCDGTNFYSAQTTSAGDFSTTGNLVVAGTSTLTGNVAVTGTLTVGGVNVESFASGTRIVFSQAAAPVGWTQDTSDTANNRMMRVVNSTGGGVAGSSDPTIMNVVPAHTHNYSGGTAGATTGTYIADPGHAHGVYDPGHSHQWGRVVAWANSSAGGGGGGNVQNQGGPSGTNASGTGIGIYGATTGTYIVDPGHAHSYSGSTDGGSSQTNWTPRYNNVIICQKN